MDWTPFLIVCAFGATALAMMLLHAQLRHIERMLDAHLELHDRRERLYEDELKQR